MKNEDAIDEDLMKRRRFTKEERIRVLKKTDSRCGHCGQKMKLWESTVDHIIPRNKGGLNDEFNLVALCYDCNGEKSNFLYDVMDYYKYILPEYIKLYVSYHKFAAYDLCKKSLFGYNLQKYLIYPDKQKAIIMSMVKRGAGKKKAMDAISKMGVSLFIARAYTGDASEIMDLIEYCKNNKNIIMTESYYDNEYSLINDIKYNEVYVLRTKNNNKICGAFMFKKINDETFGFSQLKNIIESTSLHAKYIMTGAYVNHFAHESFNNIMQDVMKTMVKMNAVPIYFDILNKSFVDADQCIIMPYEMDGVKGNVEFMTLKCIRSIFREEIESYAKRHSETLTDDELDLATDMYINYKEHSEFDVDDAEINSLFEKHPYFKKVFKPDTCPLYGVGFVDKEEMFLEYVGE